MSLHDAKARLRHATERLELRWQDALKDWRDAKSREIHSEYLIPLAAHVSAAVSALDRLAETITRAERDCRADGFES